MDKVIALGFFDSLHTGHRKLIAEAQQYATSIGAEVCVSTFDDYFFELLSKKSVKEIFTLDERKKLLSEIGVNCIKVINSSPQRFLQSGKDFFDELVADGDVAAFVCGADYTFGNAASCTVADLQKMCASNSILLKVVDTVISGETKVSSSGIRKLLAEGDIRRANVLLGRSYFCAGYVVHGRGDGRKFGVPTANLGILKQKLLPAFGVYKTITEVNGKSYQSLTNVGGQPTFDIEKPTIETLLLDFEGDLYGKYIVINFVNRIRGIQKFPSALALKKQIEKDITEAKN
ncbi:MAG: bifunctional riboflavin kinase/FAD synthetase [Clostridia bacterium]|nr:bifunctional riboflavin kinase/FAD synthetase [Clostridia bacterium]